MGSAFSPLAVRGLIGETTGFVLTDSVPHQQMMNERQAMHLLSPRTLRPATPEAELTLFTRENLKTSAVCLL